MCVCVGSVWLFVDSWVRGKSVWYWLMLMNVHSVVSDIFFLYSIVGLKNARVWIDDRSLNVSVCKERVYEKKLVWPLTRVCVCEGK